MLKGEKKTILIKDAMILTYVSKEIQTMAGEWEGPWGTLAGLVLGHCVPEQLY